MSSVAYFFAGFFFGGFCGVLTMALMAINKEPGLAEQGVDVEARALARLNKVELLAIVEHLDEEVAP
jgi:hypothetical protein